MSARVLDRVVASRLDRAAAIRWGIGAGRDDATAVRRASDALRAARQSGAQLAFATGDAWRDSVLADLALALTALLDDLTPRQAQIAALLLVDGIRQADVAAALGVSRATVSVAVARARLPAIAAACRAIEALLVAFSGSGEDSRIGLPDAARR